MPRYSLARARRVDILSSRTLELQKAVLTISFLIIGFGLLLIWPFLLLDIAGLFGILVPLQILLANVFFMGMAQAAYFVHLGFERMRRIVMAGAVGVLVGVAFYLILTPKGLWGAAVASVSSFAAYALTAVISADQILHTPGIYRLLLGALVELSRPYTLHCSSAGLLGY